MQFPQPVPSAVLDTLTRGGVVICANARAARALRKSYGESMTAQGRSAWETPGIVDWTQWLHARWMELLLAGEEERTLLTRLQEEVLWNEIVRPAVETQSLISAADVARLATSAYSLLSDYDATRQLRRGEWDPPSLESELFRKWALELERRCERNRWLCEARLPWAIAQAVSSAQLSAPSSVLWNGFDRLTPVDRAMRRVLEEAGCVQSDLAWTASASEKLLMAPSMQDELQACAVWTRNQLQQARDSTIGILLPDVGGSRAEVDRVFRTILSPARAGLPQSELLYEFTLGLPLADVPVVAVALALLQWCVAPQEQETITWLMTTGFFGPASDSAILAEADLKVRKHLSVPKLEMEEALERISKFAGPSGGNWAVANWVRNMQKALALLEKHQGRTRTCAEWVATSNAILRAAGWPGEREIRHSDSVGFQVRERWQRALEEVSALSIAERRYAFPDFLSLLAAHARSTVFSPESTGAPVTISGISESAGRCFDAVWIMGATDKALPATSRMHPLLPSWLQLELAMPGSDWDLDARLASSALARLRTSASELVFSYAKEGADGAQRPSALLALLTAEETPQVQPTRKLSTEAFVDSMIVPWPGGRAAGGHSVLKDQSACPFKAFAGVRLGAHEGPSLELGLSASDRGSIAHHVLASLWADERMRNSEDLRSLIFDGQLPALIHQHVSVGFEKFDAKASTEWERSYLQLEQERVCALMQQWIHHESRRKPFQVEKVEEKETISVEGLELNVRMDRIDKVDGGRVLIDYKTGQVDKRSWDDDRPTDPQLPIYAISGKVEELRDVLFARVVKDDFGFFSAICESKPDIFPENAGLENAAALFQEKCAEWTGVIHALSLEFQQGIATVTPKDTSSTCKYCKFPGLCRIAETAPLFAMEGDDEE